MAEQYNIADPLVGAQLEDTEQDTVGYELEDEPVEDEDNGVEDTSAEDAEHDEDEAEPDKADEEQPQEHRRAVGAFDPDTPFTPEEAELLAQLLDSGEVADQIKAQQIIARRTIQVEQQAALQAERAMVELGITPEFRAAYGPELTEAMAMAPTNLRTSREGVGLIISAAIAQRAMKAGQPLKQALLEAARYMGAREEPERAEEGLKPPKLRDVRGQAAPGGGRNSRASLEQKLKEVFGI